ncbi:MAG: 30S ribosomal protein S8e [Candidatus Micrarchaeota archaeon]|nr:30S ribosomal protein S8e [Candidatus Micrarchaeota archaeon]
MENYHGKSPTTKRGSGKKKKKFSDKKKALIGRTFTATKVSNKDKRELIRVKGGNYKVKLKYASHANILMPDGKYKRAKILSVSNTPANRHYARANIIIKGAEIVTELGNAVVLNRVGQDGVVNAKLIDNQQKQKPAQ